MTSATRFKWCEWCYGSVEMISAECSHCGSKSFLHQDMGRARLSREEAIRKREGKNYDEKPKARVSESWNSDSQSPSNTHEVGSKTLIPSSTSVFTSEENDLNAQIAEIVTQIEILDQRLQELLNKRSPELRKLIEDRDRKMTAKVVKAASITSATASGISDAIGELFSS